MKKTVIAVDLGAESGRVMAVHFDGNALQLEELHRFSNSPLQANGILHWDILCLWNEICVGIKKGEQFKPASIGVDTWGVDFALLDKDGKLIGNPVHYRDRRTENMMEVVFRKIPKKEIFHRTGIQFLPFNTIYQLASMVESDAPELKVAHTFLTIPDLLNYWLTGAKYCEFTNATTTQLYNPLSGTWAYDIIECLDIHPNIFPEIVQPGTHLGYFGDIAVTTSASHDTASAVAAVPVMGENFAYISSGTWSLVGVEAKEPVINEKALELNITNEGGVNHTYHLLKNVMGLWIVQQCRKTWQQKGDIETYAALTEQAQKAAALKSVINPNDMRFLNPGNHPQFVKDFCHEHRQRVPQSPGEIIRCVFDSLACAYREVIESIEEVTGKKIKKIHIVGGGSLNALLNQMTANVCNLPVIAGPVEATVIGNALTQLISLGEIKDLKQGRELVRNLKEIKKYRPEHTPAWENFYSRYKELDKKKE
jgi:rhamnulokinase